MNPHINPSLTDRLHTPAADLLAWRDGSRELHENYLVQIDAALSRTCTDAKTTPASGRVRSS